MEKKTFFDNYLQSIKDDFDFKLEKLSLDVTEKILEIMQKKGVNQTELAQMLDVNKASVSRLLNHGSNITLKRLLSIADTLGCDIEIRIKDKNDKPERMLTLNQTTTFSIKDNKADLYNVKNTDSEIDYNEVNEQYA
jgi:transcriptional regulator with XRE-family HTH domain